MNVSLIYFNKPTNVEKLYISYCISAIKNTNAELEIICVEEHNVEYAVNKIKKNKSNLILCFINTQTNGLLNRISIHLSNVNSYVTACYKIPSLYGYEILNLFPCFDSVIIGEIEKTVELICKELRENGIVKKGDGIIRREDINENFVCKKRELMDLDDISYPEIGRAHV